MKWWERPQSSNLEYHVGNWCEFWAEQFIEHRRRSKFKNVQQSCVSSRCDLSKSVTNTRISLRRVVAGSYDGVAWTSSSWQTSEEVGTKNKRTTSTFRPSCYVNHEQAPVDSWLTITNSFINVGCDLVNSPSLLRDGCHTDYSDVILDPLPVLWKGAGNGT